LLGPGAPAALFIINASGEISYRNKAHVDLVDKVRARCGESFVTALREGAGDIVRGATVFPVTKMVSVEEGGAHVLAEMTIDRLGNVFAGTWNDVTTKEDEWRGLLTGITTDLQQAARALASASDRLGGDTMELSARTDAIAASAVEMTTSIGEIGRSATAAAASTSAVTNAVQTVAARVFELNESSEKIGSVSQLITSIAAQTNLLALNATIEAARAGEAGRGFAVVAGEVKDLASQTSEATGNISAMITRIQEASAAVTGAIHEIVSLIGGIEDQQKAIAAAVAQQSAVSGEMSASINRVSGSTQSVARVVEQLQGAAAEVADKANQVASRI
jgi:methyl-accepting chemotaxis protein